MRDDRPGHPIIDPSASPCLPLIESLESRCLLAGDLGYLAAYGFDKRFDSGNSITVDSAGNAYVIGTFRARIDVDPRPSKQLILKSLNDKLDIFVVKYNPVGHPVWARRFGSEDDDAGLFVKLGPNGDIYIGGELRKSADFGVGQKSLIVNSHGEQDAFIARVDGGGRVVWAGSIGGEMDDFATSIAVGPDGDAYISGTIRLNGDLDPGPDVRNISTRGVDDTYISRIDGATGNLKWSRVFGENDTAESALGLQVDAQGHVFAAGVFLREVQFQRGNPAFTRESSGGTDVYLAMLSGKGDFRWIRTFGGDKDESVVDMRLGPTGDLYVTGNFEKDADFDPGAKTRILESIGDTDAYVARYRSNGALAWARQFGGQDAFMLAQALSVDAAGNVYTTGEFNDIADFDPGPGIRPLAVDKASDAQELENQSEATNTYISKLDAAGKFAFARQIGGEDGSVSGRGVGVDAAGNVFVTGAFAGVVDLDPGPGVTIRKTIDDHDESWVYVLKLLA